MWRGDFELQAATLLAELLKHLEEPESQIRYQHAQRRRLTSSSNGIVKLVLGSENGLGVMGEATAGERTGNSGLGFFSEANLDCAANAT